jgi:hypothetical protein
MNRLDFMVSELTQHGIEFRPLDNNLYLKCPFHTHSGRKFKLSIHRNGIPMHCWSCGRSGNWNDYADKVGLATIDFRPTRSIGDFSGLEYELGVEKASHVTLPRGLEPWAGPMPRFGKGPDIPERVLKRIPSYKWYDAKSGAYRIVFDAKVHRKQHARVVGWPSVVAIRLSSGAPESRPDARGGADRCSALPCS